MGEKIAPMPPYCRGDELVTLMCIVNRFRGAHEARLFCVGSCRMTLRVLFAGALVALPLLVSGALAQTPASPPAATTSPAPSANPASPAATPSPAPPAPIPANQPAATTTSAPASNPANPPAPNQGLVSPFMPEARRADDGRGRFGARRFSVDGCARLPPRPRRRRSRRRSRRLRRRARPRSATILGQPFSPTPSSPPPRRPSAIRRSSTQAAGRPTSPRSVPERRARRWRNCASAWRSKATFGRWRGKRPCLGQCAHRRR